MDATPPPSSPAYVASTGTQTNRVTRDGRASTCSLSKPTAGVTAAASPRFDAYSFTATSSGCNVVTLTGGPNVGGGTQTFAVVYSGSFDPASVTTNYLADMGSSPAFGAVNSFSFDAVAGQTYVAVVSEVPGAGASPPYTLTVTGPSLTTCDFATGSEADLSITKTDGQTSYVPGDPVVYTITAENAGPGDVTGATIADTIPPGLTGASWTCVASSGSACGAPNGSGSINTTVNLLSGGTATFTLNATVSASETGSLSNTATITAPGGVTDPDPGNNSATDTDAPPGGVYFTVTPCRVLDTRLAAGSLGGPALAAGTTRTFPVTGHCGIPANATALSINLTVTGSTAPGFLIARPTGTSTNVSTINYGSGQTRANNAVIALSGSGELDLRCGQASGTVHAIVDVSGYFVE
jgi:uncharacterized repeat protein (TIGR01451 family)